MTPPRRVTNEEIIDAYKATGSIWKAGKRLGVAGQTVHKRLASIGHPIAHAKWTEEEIEELKVLLLQGISLTEVSNRLGRTYAGVAVKVSRLDLPREYAEWRKKLPRGQGYDKAETQRRMKALLAFPGPFTKFCRAHGYRVETQARALERHCPEEWKKYVATHSDLAQKRCVYCAELFVPASAKQKYCTRRCGDQSRVDASYFGGKRRNTVGLAERQCQLCLKVVDRNLASHHVLGKQNDPDNTALVALCNGCHDLVTRLGARDWVNDPDRIEALVSLAWIRNNGARLTRLPESWVVRVAVDIEDYDEEEWE